jgi:ADP-heptose:LPS heptosyltransferase
VVLDDSIRSVALVRPRVGLGDLLCTIPALRALRRRLPDARVVLVSFAETAPVVERMTPYVDELLAFPGWPGIPERPVRGAQIGPFLRGARARRFDLAVQMYGANPAANAVVDVLGARRTAGFAAPGAGERDPRRFLAYPHGVHEIDRHLALVQLLGAGEDDGALAFPLTGADAEQAAEVRRRTGLAGGPYALLHPGATSPSRRWPLARWAQVGDALAARGLAVAVTGVRGEEELVREVRHRMRAPAADLCGWTALGAFAALLRDAALLAANDSGPAHLAAAVGTPSVTVFLSGDPVRWAHGGRHRVARTQVECNPCPHLSCPIDHRCASRVTVAGVLEEVDAALAGTIAG